MKLCLRSTARLLVAASLLLTGCSPGTTAPENGAEDDGGTNAPHDGGTSAPRDAGTSSPRDGSTSTPRDAGAPRDASTVPTGPDSDGDGYVDGDEVFAGTDPNDAESRIYEGGWPFQRDKDSLESEYSSFSWTLRPVAGERLPRVSRVDRFGESVDFYDFALHGKPIVIETTSGTCGRCVALARMLRGGTSSTFDSPEYLNFRRLVQNGDIFYILVLLNDDTGRPASAEFLSRFDDEHGYPGALMVNDPIMASTDNFTSYTFEWNTPGLILLDEDMTVSVSGAARDEIVAALYERFPPP